MLDAGLTKLDDANNAGGRTSEQCTLILTEGDSAKSLVIAGMSVAGRDNFGVFPLRQASVQNRTAGLNVIGIWVVPLSLGKPPVSSESQCYPPSMTLSLAMQGQAPECEGRQCDTDQWQCRDQCHQADPGAAAWQGIHCAESSA